MKGVLIVLALCFLFSVVNCQNTNVTVDSDACVTCIFLFTIVEENLGANPAVFEQILEQVCTLLPTIIQRQTCELIVNSLGVDGIIKLLETFNPNYICSTTYPYCVTCSVDIIDPLIGQGKQQEKDNRLLKLHYLSHLMRKTLIDPPPAEALPTVDMDGDYFSPVNDLHRTARWRGRDCDDLVVDVHAGLKDSANGLVDNNCNGIYGNDAQGQSYEQLYCESSPASSSRRSIVMFGDSASAAFRIPVEWIALNNVTEIPEAAEQELDWPHQSWSTGYTDDIKNNSMYLRLRERNLCNHLDFQNLARNGATMGSLALYQVASMAKVENPLLAFVAYIGNDVCDGSLAEMTTPDQFYQDTINGLTLLNSVAPPGSKVLMMGLVDGRILWDTLYNRIHPLGMTYENFYGFLTCTDANPCWTWLNPDSAVRNATSARAAELSAVIENIVNDPTITSAWTNLELAYMDFPLNAVLNYFKVTGQDPALLIEPVDGFHPSQIAQRYVTEFVWDYLLATNPSFLGSVNPNNLQIQTLFPNPPPY